MFRIFQTFQNQKRLYPTNLFKQTLYRFSKADKYKPKQCYYKVLNVSTEANFDEIKAQYLKLAKKYHPDANPDEIQNYERMKQDILYIIMMANDIILYQINRINSKIQPKHIIFYQKQKVVNNPNIHMLIIHEQNKGFRSVWKYDQTDNKFTNNEQYEEFLKQEQKEKKQMDEQAFDYFEKKYFQNKDYFKKNVVDDSEFELTMKLYQQHKQEVTEKKKDYVEFFPFSDSNYYVRKDVEAQAVKDNTVVGLLNDFKFPIIILIFAMAGAGVFSGVQSNERTIQKIKKSEPVFQGAGYRGNMTPVNVA